MLTAVLKLFEIYLAWRILSVLGLVLICIAALLFPETTPYVLVYTPLVLGLVTIPFAIVWAFRVIINAVRQYR